MAGGLSQMKSEWKSFKHDHAGERFQHHRQRMQCRSKTFKIVTSAIGGLLIALGAAFCVLPGPGLPLIVFGLALVAARSQRFAKLFDRAECKLRAAWRAIVRRWRVLPKPAKGSVMLGIGSLVAVVGIFTWHFVISKYLLH